MLKDIPTLQAQLRPLASDPEQTSPRASPASAVSSFAVSATDLNQRFKKQWARCHKSSTISVPLKHTPHSWLLLGWSKTEEDTGERWTTDFHYFNTFLEAVSL